MSRAATLVVPLRIVSPRGSSRIQNAQIDSAAGDSCVSFYSVQVHSLLEAAPETSEAIATHRCLSPQRIWAAIDAAEIQDSFTIQALALAGLTR